MFFTHIAIQVTNVIAYPCFFETVRFPVQDKSETLSLLRTTSVVR